MRRHADAEQAPLAGDAVAGQLAAGDLRVDDRGDARPRAPPGCRGRCRRRSPRAARRRGSPARGGRCRRPAGRPAAARRRGSSPSGGPGRRGRGARPRGRAPSSVRPRVSRPRLLASAWWPLMCWTSTGWTRVASSRSQRVGRRPSRNISGFIPTARIHCAVGRALGGLGDARDEVRDRRDARVARVDRRQLRAGEREVVVGVDEARAGSVWPATSMNRASGGAAARDGVIAADRHDAVAGDGDPAAERRFAGPRREHATVEQDEPAHRRSSSHGRLRIASIVPASAADYDASVLMKELAMVPVPRGMPRAEAEGGGSSMHRWTTIVAFLAIIAIVAGCSAGGGASPARRHRPRRHRPRASRQPGASGSAAAGDSAACNPPRQEGVTLTFVSFGGVYQEAQRKAWLEPYTELTGVQFTEDENSSNATIKAQVEVRPGDLGRRRCRQRLRSRRPRGPARAARLLARSRATS